MLVPLLCVLNFECNLKLGPEWLTVSIIASSMLCSLAIFLAHISIAARICLLLVSLVLWLTVVAGIFRLYAGFIL